MKAIEILENYRHFGILAKIRFYRIEHLKQYEKYYCLDDFYQELRAEADDYLRRQKEIADMINSLPEPYKSVLYLRFIDGLTVEQIAEKLYFSFRWTQRLQKKALELLERSVPT